MNKKKLSVLVATALITAAVSIPVHAQDGDIYSVSTTTATDKGNIVNIILKDKTTLLDMTNNMENYGYEMTDKIYNLTDVNNEFNKNPSQTVAQLQANVKTNLTATSYIPSANLTGTFNSLLGQTYATVTLPAGTTIASITKDGTVIPTANYSVNGTILTITNAIATDTISITTSDGHVYTVVSGSSNSTTSVSSVTTNSATSFQVKFAQAPADTSKIEFNVTREGAPVTLTTSWDSTNPVATLTYSSNLPQDTYAVDVKDGSTDLGSTNVSVTAQHIGKIEITSTVLGVSSPNTSGVVTVGGNGYATYKVLDQYGNDITTSGLAQGITWTCGVGTITANNGLLTITPFKGDFLTNYTTVTINGFDTTTGNTANTDLTTP